MKYTSTLIAVKDMEAAKKFYYDVLGLRVVLDFGENVTLTGGIALQESKLWKEFIGGKPIAFGGNDAELYFETEQFDSDRKRIAECGVVPFFETTHGWGQRVVRFYDPDLHIAEVGESMKKVVERFLESGLTAEEAAQKSQMPLSYVKRIAKK